MTVRLLSEIDQQLKCAFIFSYIWASLEACQRVIEHLNNNKFNFFTNHKEVTVKNGMQALLLTKAEN